MWHDIVSFDNSERKLTVNFLRNNATYFITEQYIVKQNDPELALIVTQSAPQMYRSFTKVALSSKHLTLRQEC